MDANKRKWLLRAGLVAGCAALAGILFPIVLPFILGAGLALMAEPAVSLLHRHSRLPRGAAAGVGVTVVVLLALTVLVLLVSVLVRQLGRLGGILPQLGAAVQQGMGTARQWALALSARLPESIAQVASRFTEQMFSDGSALMSEAVSRVPQAATALISGLSEGALGLFTAVLSAYMLSARLPQLRQWCRKKLPASFHSHFLPALAQLRRAILGWLLAQGKLMGLTFLLLLSGFMLLRIPGSLALAALIALVDAFPVLGTGTVLLPWSLICLLQGQTARGVGLLAVYAVAWLARSILEPKILGKELGLDPLVTLLAMYAGFRLWGLGGMLLSPLAALTCVQLLHQRPLPGDGAGPHQQLP